MLERTEVDEQPDARVVGPVVRAPEHLRLEDPQVRPGGGLPGGRLALGALAVAPRRGGAGTLRRSAAPRPCSGRTRLAFPRPPWPWPWPSAGPTGAASTRRTWLTRCAARPGGRGAPRGLPPRRDGSSTEKLFAPSEATARDIVVGRRARPPTRTVGSATGSSARCSRSNPNPLGSEWSVAPETIIGRYPFVWNASVTTFAPSTMVTAPRPMTSRVWSGWMIAAVSSSRPSPISDGDCATAASRRPSRVRCSKCWSMTTPRTIPRPADICAIRCFGVAPDAPNAIMCVATALAPADVPAITAPRSCASISARPSRVPPTTDDSRSWLPPVRNTPVASSSTSAACGLVRVLPGHRAAGPSRGPRPCRGTGSGRTPSRRRPGWTPSR